MKRLNILFSSLAMTLVISLFIGCSKTDNDEKSAAPMETNEVPAKAGVMLDASMMGLKIESPAALAWSPKVKGFGSVVAPATLAADFSDLESERSTMEISSNEYVRQKTLAAQNNASVRSLETAQAAATRDELLFNATRAKFAMSWGERLTKSGNDDIKPIINGQTVLVRVDLPFGEEPKFTPRTASITAPGDESVAIDLDFFDIYKGVDAATQMQGFLYLTKAGRLKSGMAIVAELEDDSLPTNGVVVPDSAILRHEGAGWVYVQTETNRFVRTEIPLDRRTTNGWFVSEKLSATNRIVVVGAQAVLSAELSGGGFTTGERD